MSDITHRGWIIGPATVGFDIQHPDFDRENELDWRHGHADTIEAARVEIDRLLADDAEWTEAASILKTGLLQSEQAVSCNVETNDDGRQQPRDDWADGASTDLGATSGRSGHDQGQRDGAEGRGKVPGVPDEVTAKGWHVAATPKATIPATGHSATEGEGA